MKRYKIAIEEHIAALSLLKNMDFTVISRIIEIVSESKNLFLTGVGKNADLMYKISKTFNSVSIRCHFIDPVNAVHGDIGVIPVGSTIIASSKSGTTEELVRFLRAIKSLNEGHQVVVIHCNENLGNVDYADHTICIPVKNEADHLNIVPTTSLCAIEVLLHSVACEIIESRNFTKSDMSRNHPAGNLGKICAI